MMNQSRIYTPEQRFQQNESIKEWRISNETYLKSYQEKYYSKHKDKIQKYQKEYRLANKESISKRRKEYFKLYRENNKEKIKERRKHKKEEYNRKIRLSNKNRMKNDPLFRMRCKISKLICISMKGLGYTKKSKTFGILGCSFEEFKLHIENRFQEGMSWENHGEWHYDHIIPVSMASSENELIKLNHYTNFQPLWAIDNIRKGNKLI